MRRVHARFTGCIVASLLLVALASAGVVAAAASDGEGTGGHERVELKVMTFNIWVGGTQVDFAQVPVAIQTAGADIVGIQEPRENLQLIAQSLGYYYHPGLNILSRFPILTPQDASPQYVLIEVNPGKVVAASNVHLRAYPYGPYELRDGLDVESVLLAEQHHVLEVQGRLEALARLADQGVPVFLTGDFNVPSHLDWTKETAEASSEAFRRQVPWPVSVLLEEKGFRDTFREHRPDAVATPGYTWSPGYPVPRLDANEVHDRIDFVYASGPSQTLSSLVVGEPGPISDVVVTPWPSDHRAVVSHFAVTPIPIDALEMDTPATLDGEAVIPAGQSVVLRYAGGTGHPEAWVGLYRKGTTPGRPNPSLRWSYISGTGGELVLDGSRGSGPVWPLAPGVYEAHLFADGGYTIIASWEFRVE